MLKILFDTLNKINNLFTGTPPPPTITATLIEMYNKRLRRRHCRDSLKYVLPRRASNVFIYWTFWILKANMFIWKIYNVSEIMRAQGVSGNVERSKSYTSSMLQIKGRIHFISFIYNRIKVFFITFVEQFSVCGFSYIKRL